jgi:glucose-1-phosphate adenylyltransferase
MAEFHLRSAAAISVAAVPVPLPRARSFGVIAAAPDGRIADFEEKPARPAPMRTQPTHAYASMGNYLFEREALVELLAQARRRGETDFGAHVLPRALRTHRMFAYDFATNRIPGLRAFEETAYWRDIGTLDAYRAAERDVSGSQPNFALENPQWPIRGDALACVSTTDAARKTRGSAAAPSGRFIPCAAA